MNNRINQNMTDEEWNKKVKEICLRDKAHIKKLSEND